jgi:hypothetical protein
LLENGGDFGIDHEQGSGARGQGSGVGGTVLFWGRVGRCVSLIL